MLIIAITTIIILLNNKLKEDDSLDYNDFWDDVEIDITDGTDENYDPKLKHQKVLAYLNGTDKAIFTVLSGNVVNDEDLLLIYDGYM